MPRTKRYEPHCPSTQCSGGYSHRLGKTSAESVEMPPDMLARREGTDLIYRCSYCGFVWFQSSASYPGFDPTPAGFYDNFMAPSEFVPVPQTYRIREENTSNYWREKQERRLKRKRR
jgi:hypothetical protein